MLRCDALRRGLLCVAAAAGSVAFVGSAQAGMSVATGTGPSGNTYEVIRDPAATWSAAQEAATAAGGRLVSITSDQEQQFVNQLLTTNNVEAGGYWIGLQEMGGNNNFKWTSGEALSYANWTENQPDDFGGNETVGSLLWSRPTDTLTFDRRGEWNDLPDPYTASGSIYADLNTGGYIMEFGDAGMGGGGVGNGGGGNAVPLPAPAALIPLGLLVAWRARRKVASWR